MVEMCLVLAILSVLMAVFLLPRAYQRHTLTLSMLRLQSFIETVQSEAVASGEVRSVTMTAHEALSETQSLSLPSTLSCEAAVIHFYPQYTSSPAASIRCKDAYSEQTLVIQLGRGRSEIRAGA